MPEDFRLAARQALRSCVRPKRAPFRSGELFDRFVRSIVATGAPREQGRHRAGVQAFLSALPVQLGVRVAHVERDHIAGDKTGFTCGREFGGRSGQSRLRYKADLQHYL